MAVMSDTKAEVRFQHVAQPRLAELGVDLIGLRHDESSHLLSVVMRIPDQTARTVRRRALAVLSEFEHATSDQVLTDPMFVWDADDDDES